MSPRSRRIQLIVVLLAAFAAAWTGARVARADLIEAPEVQADRVRRSPRPQARNSVSPSPSDLQDLYLPEESPVSPWREHLLPFLMLAGVGGVLGLVVIGSMARRHAPPGSGRGGRRGQADAAANPAAPRPGHVSFITLMTMLGGEGSHARRHRSSKRSPHSSGRSSHRHVRRIEPLREYDNDI